MLSPAGNKPSHFSTTVSTCGSQRTCRVLPDPPLELQLLLQGNPVTFDISSCTGTLLDLIYPLEAQVQVFLIYVCCLHSPLRALSQSCLTCDCHILKYPAQSLACHRALANHVMLRSLVPVCIITIVLTPQFGSYDRTGAFEFFICR